MDDLEFYDKQVKFEESMSKIQQERTKLKQQFYTMVLSSKKLKTLRLNDLKSYHKKICEREKKAKERNKKLLVEFKGMETRLASIQSETSRIQSLKKRYEEDVMRLYPQWRHQMEVAKAKQQLEELGFRSPSHHVTAKPPQSSVLQQTSSIHQHTPSPSDESALAKPHQTASQPDFRSPSYDALQGQAVPRRPVPVTPLQMPSMQSTPSPVYAGQRRGSESKSRPRVVQTNVKLDDVLSDADASYVTGASEQQIPASDVTPEAIYEVPSRALSTTDDDSDHMGAKIDGPHRESRLLVGNASQHRVQQGHDDRKQAPQPQQSHRIGHGGSHGGIDIRDIFEEDSDDVDDADSPPGLDSGAGRQSGGSSVLGDEQDELHPTTAQAATSAARVSGSASVSVISPPTHATIPTSGGDVVQHAELHTARTDPITDSDRVGTERSDDSFDSDEDVSSSAPKDSRRNTNDDLKRMNTDDDDDAVAGKEKAQVKKQPSPIVIPGIKDVTMESTLSDTATSLTTPRTNDPPLTANAAYQALVKGHSVSARKAYDDDDDDDDDLDNVLSLATTSNAAKNKSGMHGYDNKSQSGGSGSDSDSFFGDRLQKVTSSTRASEDRPAPASPASQPQIKPKSYRAPWETDSDDDLSVAIPGKRKQVLQDEDFDFFD